MLASNIKNQSVISKFIKSASWEAFKRFTEVVPTTGNIFEG